MRTGDLIPRLAWGVGHRNASERRVRCCSCLWGAFKWKTLGYIHVIMGIFSSFVVKYFITKLEINQTDTMCHSPAGWSRGLADVVIRVY